MIILDDGHLSRQDFWDQVSLILNLDHNVKQIDTHDFLSQQIHQRNDILFVNLSYLLSQLSQFENYYVMAKTYTGVFYFVKDDPSSELLQFLESSLTLSLKNTIAIYKWPLNKMDEINFHSQLNFLKQIFEDQFYMQKQLVNMDDEIEALLNEAKNEMDKLKKLHHKTVPMRHEKIKGLDFLLKFQVGDGVLVEYFDLVATHDRVYEIIFSTSSYLLSSTFIQVLNRHKNQFDPHVFLTELKSVLHNENSSVSEDDFSYLIVEINPSSLISQLITNKKWTIFRQNVDQFLPVVDDHFTLQRGEKVIVFSEGFSQNWESSLTNIQLQTFLNSSRLHEQVGKDLMTELFFQMNEGLQTNTLKKDSTIIMLEVNRYGIYEV